MEEETFDKPRLAINRVYTRQGDQGETALAEEDSEYSRKTAAASRPMAHSTS